MAATGDLPSLPAAVEVAAYRIALEALNNVLRHAAASSRTIRLAFHDQALYLEVTDDGRGITQPPRRWAWTWPACANAPPSSAAPAPSPPRPPAALECPPTCPARTNQPLREATSPRTRSHQPWRSPSAS
jgi:hypothetical protein